MADIEKEKGKLMALFSDDLEKTLTVLNFRHKLTPFWFEVYVANFFREFGSFRTFANGGFLDGGIDIKGMRIIKDNQIEYLIVQCKKWSVYPIREKDVAQFYGKIAQLKFQYPNTYLVYATTGEVNAYAENFADKNEIFITKYSDLIKMEESYSLNRFTKEILEQWVYELEKIFEKNVATVLLSKYSNKVQNDTRTKVESAKSLYELLREVRLQFARKEDIPAHCVFTNKMLENICESKPRNINELKNIKGFWNTRTQKYGNQILELIAQM